MKDIILQLINVNKIFKTKSQDVWVLKNINLEIKSGEFIILFGPSGCGKSTMLHLILGLENTSAGSIQFYDLAVDKATSDDIAEFRKNNIGIIYQQSNWIKSMNVLSNVAFPLILKGVSKDEALQRANETIQLVGMSQWIDYLPTDLSAGQQQKIGLARCLVTNPKVIIADEPSGNLDYKSSLELMSLFKRLRDAGKTIILVTHSLDNIDYADRIVQMFDGRVLRIIKTAENTLEQIIALITNKEGILQLAPLEKSSIGKLNSDIDDSVGSIKSFINAVKMIISTFITSLKSIVLLLLFIIYTALYKVFRLKFIPRSLLRIYSFFVSKLMLVVNIVDKRGSNTIKYFDLIDMSIKNLFSKRTRTVITIGGIAIGISFTVLLFSIGFGVEQLIVSRVATLNEIKQIDVIPAVSSNVYINDESIDKFNNIQGVNEVLPIISVAGKVKYKESLSDSVIYGVKRSHFNGVDLQLSSGEQFLQLDESITFTNNDFELPEGTDVELDTEDSSQASRSIVITIPNSTDKKIIVNKAILDLYNIPEATAIGEELEIEFIATGNQVRDQYKIQSSLVSYEIIGTTLDSDSPIAYVPINDLKPLGINKYSQIKVIVNDRDKVSEVRRSIEALGFRTNSIIDTVSQIESLFSNIRLIFAIVGLIALIVASLGMFNTLTISLLERTREVGLMKAIGMRSTEVKELFLTESIMMGLFGGLAGIALGFFLGEVISFLLSSVSIARGGEYISLTYLPFNTALDILILSVIIGILTGFYPAYRSTKISALDALRYE